LYINVKFYVMQDSVRWVYARSQHIIRGETIL